MTHLTASGRTGGPVTAAMIADFKLVLQFSSFPQLVQYLLMGPCDQALPDRTVPTLRESIRPYHSHSPSCESPYRPTAPWDPPEGPPGMPRATLKTTQTHHFLN